MHTIFLQSSLCTQGCARSAIIHIHSSYVITMSENKTPLDIDPALNRARASISSGARSRSGSRKRTLSNSALAVDNVKKSAKHDPNSNTLKDLWQGSMDKMASSDSVEVAAPSPSVDCSTMQEKLSDAANSIDTPHADFLQSALPLLVNALTPMIKDIISKELQVVTSRIDDLKVIEPKIPQIDHIDKRLDKIAATIEQFPKLVDDVSSNKADISVLQEKHDVLKKRVEILENRLTLRFDDLEQYGRRNAVRLLNVKYDHLEKDPDGSYVKTDEYVYALAKDVLGINLPPHSIARSHLLGPPKNGKCNVIVKFVSYNIRSAFFSNRVKLKDSKFNHIRIVEDLTKRRQGLIRSFIQLRKDKQIYSYWSKDGRLYIKESDTSKPCQIHNADDLVKRNLTSE